MVLVLVSGLERILQPHAGKRLEISSIRPGVITHRLCNLNLPERWQAFASHNSISAHVWMLCQASKALQRAQTCDRPAGVTHPDSSRQHTAETCMPQVRDLFS